MTMEHLSTFRGQACVVSCIIHVLNNIYDLSRKKKKLRVQAVALSDHMFWGEHQREDMSLLRVMVSLPLEVRAESMFRLGLSKGFSRKRLIL
jgi:hypothetical protein